MTANENVLSPALHAAHDSPRLVRRLVLVLVASILVAGGAYLWRQTRSRNAPLVVRDRLIRPEMREVDATVTATGIIRLRSGAEVRVGAQISGIVTKLNVTVGSHIQRGAAIAEIESRGLDARIAQARSQIDVDQAALTKVERELERSRKLLLEKLIARQQTDDLESDLRSAEARLEKSRSDLTVVESDLPYLTIRAPISGTVSSISTQQGETVAASFNAPTFVTIIEDNALELVAMVDETDIGAVRRSNPVVFTTETFPAIEFRGTVERVAPKATIVSGVVNYETAIAIQAGSRSLRPDMTANIVISTARHRSLMIPAEALHQQGDERFVYIDRNRVPVKRDVTVGQRRGSWNEVRSGLALEDRVFAGAQPPARGNQ